MTIHLEPAQISSDRLAMMYRLSQRFNACCLDLEELLNLVLDEVIAATQAERGLVTILDVTGKCALRVMHGLDQVAMHHPQFRYSRRVMGQVARGGKPILTKNKEANVQLAQRHGWSGLEFRSILCVPLITREMVSGFFYVDSLMQSQTLNQDDLNLLTAIADSAAVAIDNARLYQTAVSNARLEREMQMAHDIQAGLLPQKTPQFPGWEFATHWQPAREVGGDYFDFISNDNRQVGLVIADVSDKGIPAALFMANTRAIVRAGIHSSPSVAEAINRANRLINADATDGMFVTLFYALIDPDGGDMTYVNAGHNPPLLFRRNQMQLSELSRTGMALGVDGDAAYEQRTVKLNPGDFIVLYTDGVTDAIDDQDRFFGVERLQRVLLDNRQASAREVIAALQQAITDFIGQAASFDDIAIIVARYQN